MTDKSCLTQTDEHIWENLMRQAVKLYVDEKIEAQQDVFSERTLKRIRMIEMRKRNLTVVVGGVGKKSVPLWRSHSSH